MNIEEKWDYMYNLLVEYKKKYGDLEVNSRYVTEDGKRLGKWISTQRTRYKNNKLSEDRIEKLKELGFRFENIDLDALWEYWYNLLVEYKNKYGSTEVPSEYVTPNGERLGAWVHNQRQFYKNNKLSEDRIEKLKELGFRFENIYFDALWEYWYNLLVEYKKKYGSAEVPYNYLTPSGEILGKWVYTQRALYKSDKLSEDRIEKLKELGFRFENIYFDARWEYWYNLLVEYKKRYGSAEVSINYVTPNGERLGAWVHNQRQFYKNNKLSEDRIEKLKELGFRFENIDLDVLWEYWYNLLVEYKKRYGDTKVSQGYVTPSGERLGLWVQQQRQLYRSDKLSEDRIERLKEIVFRLEKIDLDERWEYWYNLLIEYKNKYGSTEVPREYETQDGKRLGKWINTQRTLYKNNKLSGDRIEKLKEIGFRLEKIDKSSVERIRKLTELNFKFDNTDGYVKKLCILYNIDYKRNRVVLDKLPYSDFMCRLYYLLDNYMNIVDDNGNLNIIFGMDDNPLYLLTGFTGEELREYYSYMIGLEDGYYQKEKSKNPVIIKRR